MCGTLWMSATWMSAQRVGDRPGRAIEHCKMPHVRCVTREPTCVSATVSLTYLQSAGHIVSGQNRQHAIIGVGACGGWVELGRGQDGRLQATR